MMLHSITFRYDSASTVGIDEVLLPEENGNDEIFNIFGSKVTGLRSFKQKTLNKEEKTADN